MHDLAATTLLMTAPMRRPVRPPAVVRMPPRRPHRAGRTRRLAAALLVAATVAGLGLAGTARGADGRRPARLLVVTATDFALALPATVPAGPTRIRLVNHGAEMHQAAFVRLRPGHTLDQLFGALAADGFRGAADHGTFVGGPNGAAVGSGSEATADLAPGQYVALCLVPSADGVFHVMKGMFTRFDVTGTTTATARRAPIRVTLDEFRFGVPKRFVDAVSAGRPVEVVNHGTQHHELVVSRLHPGATTTDLARWNDAPAGTAGPSPATDVAGITMLPPGGHGQLRAALAPGRYVLVCFLPDEAGSGHSHLHNGMVFPFTVR